MYTYGSVSSDYIGLRHIDLELLPSDVNNCLNQSVSCKNPLRRVIFNLESANNNTQCA